MPLEGPIRDSSDLAGFDMVSKLEPEDFTGARQIIENVGVQKAHFMSIQDPFKVSWRRRESMQNLLMDYVLNPQLVHDLARIATEFDMAAMDMALQIGVDVIVVPGDLAGEQTTIMSPRHYREYIKPYHKELVDHAHRKGAKIVKHSDGNVWPILDDLLEVGFDGIHPIQPQCMDIAEVKEHIAGRACILGNIDCRDLLPFGSEEEVEEWSRRRSKRRLREGAISSAPPTRSTRACKPENYIAMVRAAHQYGVYAD